jgi:hypothetical protein
MDVHLHTKINDVVEAFRPELHQKALRWSTIRTPSALFDFEQHLQAVLNKLHTEIVGAVLEAIHRDTAFVTDCLHQALYQRRVHIQSYRDVSVRTLSGQCIRIKTPYAVPPKTWGQICREAKPRQQGVGIYPVLRRLGVLGRTTPRLLAEVTHDIADASSAGEAEERFASCEIRLSESHIWGQLHHFASIALWQWQVAVPTWLRPRSSHLLLWRANG